MGSGEVGGCGAACVGGTEKMAGNSSESVDGLRRRVRRLCIGGESVMSYIVYTESQNLHV